MQEDFAAVHRITEAPTAGPSTTSLAARQAAAASSSNQTAAVAASSKLEPYLVLARSARGPGAAAIVVDQVTAAAGVFCFGELLDVPAIAELEHSEQYRPRWLILQIFAFGVLKDYKDHADTLPKLTEAQITKLKLLTLVDLAGQHQYLAYNQLLPALEVSSIRQLEDLIIEALYSDLLKARINQKNQVLEVDSVIGRDVKASTSTSTSIGSQKTVAAMMQSLRVWHDRVTATLGELDYHIRTLRDREYSRHQAESHQSDQVQKALEAVKLSSVASKDKERNTKLQAGYGGWQQQSAWQSMTSASGAGAGETGFEQDEAMELDSTGPKKSPTKGANRKRSRQ